MGGRHINDHSSWIGKASKDSPLPIGNKVKDESSAEGAGGIKRYEDTTETIKAQQEANKSQIHKHPLKPNYRN
jgi:hypothetical protein